jgi:hypothetical protein
MKPKDFSLEFLYKGAKPSGKRAEKGTGPIGEAVLLYSRPILEDLKGKENREAHLHDLARSTRISIKDIFQVIPALELSGLVEVVQKDEITGNDLIRLTEEGSTKIA